MKNLKVVPHLELFSVMVAIMKMNAVMVPTSLVFQPEKTFGVARKANLTAVKVLDKHGNGTLSGIVNGLAFVLDNHSKAENKNSVVNMSLGCPFSDILNHAVESLTAAGIHVVVSAGNNALDACLKSPASELYGRCYR